MNPKTDCVYFIEAENGWVKIGRTQTLRQRFQSHRAASPIPLKLLCAFECNGDATKVEKEWHKRFHSKKAYGEWFRLDEQDKARFMSSSDWPMMDISGIAIETMECPGCGRICKGLSGFKTHRRSCQLARTAQSEKERT